MVTPARSRTRSRGVAQSFFDLNRRGCDWIERRLPTGLTRSFNRLYEKTVLERIPERADFTVLDVGGGRTCHFARTPAGRRPAQIIATDISFEELAHNRDADHRVVCDATADFPLRDGSADIVTVRSVLEHLRDVSRFVEEAYRVLKPGGWFVGLCPGKFAPFSIANQILPPAVARAVLYSVHPSFREDCGFRAYYDKTYPSAMRTLLERAGFRTTEIHRRYYQSIYFNFLLPLYLASLAYDALMWRAGLKNAASQLLIVAQK
jgi:ubiquinone/menaquinone biosynthesis C-methylase UbiE